MNGFIQAAIGGVVAGIVCFSVGFLIVITAGLPTDAYFGFGIQPWNLPGTILGFAAWWLVIRWQRRRSGNPRSS